MPKYDLEERTAKFGEDIIEFVKKVPTTSITNPLIGQLVRAGASVGANYCEADNASSKKDFINKIALCKKESRETKHWLRMIAKAAESLKEETKKYMIEAQELNFIFVSIIHKCNRR